MADDELGSKKAVVALPISKMILDHENSSTQQFSIQKSTVKLRSTCSRLWTEGRLLESTDICCWWDHHPFTTVPIGLPTKKYSKATNIEYEGYAPKCFETDGIFCGFPCAMAYCNTQTSPLYKDSKQLLYDLQYELLGDTSVIKAADHWKDLKSHGGKWTIQQFRERSKSPKTNYVLTENIVHIVIQVPCGRYMEKIV